MLADQQSECEMYAKSLNRINNQRKVLQTTINDEALKIASSLLIISAIFQIADGIQAVVLGALKGLQDVSIPTAITFISYWLIGFPVSYYLGIIYNFQEKSNRRLF